MAQAVASRPGRAAAGPRARRSARLLGEKGAPGGGAGRARGRVCASPRSRPAAAKGKKRGPRRGLLRLVNLFPLPFNPPPGRLSFQDRRGCKPFEVHQHGEVLLYFRSPRFIPGRGSGRPGRLLRSLGLPRRTRGRWTLASRAGAGGSRRHRTRTRAPSAPSDGRSRPAPQRPPR